MPFDKSRAIEIVKEIQHRDELPWVELKENNSGPQEIGEYVSALANSAALYKQNFGFMVWGIDDKTREIKGTTFVPVKAKQGNQTLDLWIGTQLEPQVQFYFHTLDVEGHPIVLLEVAAAYSTPVKFRDIEYIRIGENKKKLKDFPDTERQLWSAFSTMLFEEQVSYDGVASEVVLQLLDHQAFFDKLSLDLPGNTESILGRLQAEAMIARNESGMYEITNLGAILFAKRLSDFRTLERKSIRFIKYDGDSRIAPSSKEHVVSSGYAVGFEGLIDTINGFLPHNEIIGTALRKTVPMFPELAIRELIANLMIHQDFSMRGTDPMIELFNTRIEITNPGVPIIETNRFVDHPPISRNEKLASFMRRIGICEERGSGFDKVVAMTEAYQLPAPEIEIFENHTRVILYAHSTFASMSKTDRLRACYLHACLKRVNRDFMTNASLRERFAVDAKNSSMISRLLNEALNVGLIKLSEDSDALKSRRYLPYWA